jgi:hypothetical protein
MPPAPDANFLGREAKALGLYLQPDGKTYAWTPAPPGAAPPIAPADRSEGGEGDGTAKLR